MLFAWLSLLLAHSPAAAQQNPLLPEGTSSISGQVVAADTGKPVPARSWDRDYNNLSARFPRVTTEEGPVRIHRRLQVLSWRHRRPPRRMQSASGSRVPLITESARTIALAAGQARDADFALSGFSAIEGVIVDEFGDPVPNAAIQVSQVQYAGGRRRLLPVNPSSDVGPLRPTDDLGRFRVGGLPPGDYYVEALSGAFADPTAAGGFAITFFPGTTRASAAQVVTVAAGRDAQNVSFALTPAPGAHVSGTLVDGTGGPIARGTLMLMPSESAGTALFVIVRSATDERGRFTFRNVPPGVYTIQAFGAPVGTGGNLNSSAFGYRTFTVEGQNIDALVVTVPAPRTIRGRITFDGDMSMLPKTTHEVIISARQINFESAPIGGGPPPTAIREDWTFEIGAMSGQRLVTASTRPSASAGPGWMVKRVMLNGQDVTDVPLDLREQDVNGLEVVLTTRASTVTGTVTDADDKPLADFSVVIFADDEAKWTTWSRFIVAPRTGPKGTFTVRGLPAGSYIAVGVVPSAGGEWQDPEFLRTQRARPDAVRFALGDEGSHTFKITVRK
jgi:protocatechuate 3,4-dioxygenase beta subunit